MKSLIASLLLVILAAPNYARSQAPIHLNFQGSMPCETYEPNCDGDDRGGEEDDDADPQRPGDPDGPDSVGDDSEI